MSEKEFEVVYGRKISMGRDRPGYEFKGMFASGSGKGSSDQDLCDMPPKGYATGCLVPFMLLISSFGGIVAVLVAVLFVKGG